MEILDRKELFESAGWQVENVSGKGFCLTDRRQFYTGGEWDLMHCPCRVADSADIYRRYGPGSHRERIHQRPAYHGLKGEKPGKGPKFGSTSSFKPRSTDW